MGGGKSSDIRLPTQVYAGSREESDRFRRSPPSLKPGSIIPMLASSVKPALWRDSEKSGAERQSSPRLATFIRKWVLPPQLRELMGRLKLQAGGQRSTSRQTQHVDVMTRYAPGTLIKVVLAVTAR
jgi:hypothetical protein